MDLHKIIVPALIMAHQEGTCDLTQPLGRLNTTASPNGYAEEGMNNFYFKGTDTGWFISSRTWEIKACSHPDFKEWKQNQK